MQGNVSLLLREDRSFECIAFIYFFFVKILVTGPLSHLWVIRRINLIFVYLFFIFIVETYALQISFFYISNFKKNMQYGSNVFKIFRLNIEIAIFQSDKSKYSDNFFFLTGKHENTFQYKQENKMLFVFYDHSKTFPKICKLFKTTLPSIGRRILRNFDFINQISDIQDHVKSFLCYLSLEM